ncbi:hypothetical protein, partial [Psychroserpens mesophilus]|uniref:hypothetical protein n=1 Tax=Psychroserpens mesophilus TaxID=325473 RepID=UPI003D65028E
LTLILSFVLSDLLPNVLKDKLKTCITNCSVCVYSENPADFPTGSVSFANLVPANATSHTQNRYQKYVENQLYSIT